VGRLGRFGVGTNFTETPLKGSVAAVWCTPVKSFVPIHVRPNEKMCTADPIQGGRGKKSRMRKFPFLGSFDLKMKTEMVWPKGVRGGGGKGGKREVR